MRTARTVQLSDANNNNISPATSVESLYFELSKEGGIYRMSLGNRFVVAAEDSNFINPENLTLTQVPYSYVKEVTGTSATVWQIKAGNYDI